jgi:hypothetical protein
MGRSLVTHPSDGKLAALVGDGTFGRWVCLGLVACGLVLFAQHHPSGVSVFCVEVVLVFVGMVNFGMWIDLE